MNFLLISAGTKAHGATERALLEAKNTVIENCESCDVFNIYTSAIAPCCGCNYCKKYGRCVREDEVNKALEIIGSFDGFMFFSPVHYGGASGGLISFMTRLFYSGKGLMRHKPAAAVTVSRRGGNFTALEEITRFFGFASMPNASGCYPGIIHGSSYEDVSSDFEGLQTVRSITENLIWLARSIDIARQNGIMPPRE